MCADNNEVDAKSEAARLVNSTHSHAMRGVLAVLDQDARPLSLCRCWQSKVFPRCDGSHKLLKREDGTPVLGPIRLVAKDSQ
jgi:CDGSH-type Zn-finger protein